MWSTIILIVLATAHLHLIDPLPKFTNGPGNENAPSQLCSQVKFTPDAPAAVLASFKSSLGNSSLKSYADSCGGKQCGHTVSNHIVPVPSEHQVKVTVGARHVGFVEIWIDDKLAAQADQLLDSYPVEFSLCKGKCVLRMITVALHVFPAEIFDNCVTLNGSDVTNTPNPDADIEIKKQDILEIPKQETPLNPATNPAAIQIKKQDIPTVLKVEPVPVSTKVAETKKQDTPTVPKVEPVPVPTKIAETKKQDVPLKSKQFEPQSELPTVVTSTVKEISEQTLIPLSDQLISEQYDIWSCNESNAGLVRNVNGVKYEFACPLGTSCYVADGLGYTVCK